MQHQRFGSGIDWDAGVTVQVLARHPNISTAIRWAHNLLEKTPTTIAMYNNMPKPAGWGNGGGGLEKDDLETLAKLFPEHPILTDSSLSEDQRLIIAGGIREFVYETGYRDIEIITEYPGVFLFDYDYPPEPGKLNGHRKITLWGQITSFVEHPRVETWEIDKTDWIDMASSLPGRFFNRLEYPDRPYRSHIFSSLVGLLRIYRHLRATSDGFVENIPRQIHPSWWYILQVGKGDSRFPKGGYKLSLGEWHRLFDEMVKKRMATADNDFLLRFLRGNVENAKRAEEERLANGELLTGKPDNEKPSGEIDQPQPVEGVADSSRIPTTEEMVRMEDEAYAQWLEGELGLNQ